MLPKTEKKKKKIKRKSLLLISLYLAIALFMIWLLLVLVLIFFFLNDESKEKLVLDKLYSIADFETDLTKELSGILNSSDETNGSSD